MTNAWCSDLNADEPMAGTAPQATAHVFLEHLGPWPAKPLEALEASYASELSTLHAAVALARRPAPTRQGTSGLPDRPHVIVARDGLVAVTRTDGPPAVAAVAAALAALGRGEVPLGWTQAGWLVMVCTHARRDTCCARLGRPLADALLAVAPADRIWETTHLGGHRFAPTCLALPSGVVYGRVTSDRVPGLVAAIEHSEVVPDLMRGRTSYSAPLQVAEVAARDRLGVVDATLELMGSATDSDRTLSTWRADGATLDLVVDALPGPPRKLSCAKDTLESRPKFVVARGAEAGSVTPPS